MAKPDVTICPECEAEIHYLTKENSITCSICSTIIEVTPSEIVEEEPVQIEEPQPTELELLQAQVQTQQTIIDDLLFNIIPNMTGGEL